MAETATRRRWFRRERTEERALTRENLPSIFFADPAMGAESMSLEEALRSPAVYGIIAALTNAATRCPPRVMRDGAAITAGPTVDLLNTPRPGFHWPSFLGQLVTYLALCQEAYVAKRRLAGDLVQLTVIPPTQITVEIIAGEPRYTLYEPSGKVVKNLTLNDVVPIIGVTLDGIRSVWPIKAGRELIALSRSLSVYVEALWRRGGLPVGILTVPGGPNSDEAAKNLKQAFTAQHSGPAKAGSVAVMTGPGTEWQALSESLMDSAFEATWRCTVADIARLLGVTPATVNAESQDSLTYATTRDQDQQFMRWSLGGPLKLIETALSADADICPGDLRVEFTPEQPAPVEEVANA